MALNWQRFTWAGLLLLGAAVALACEDNPDECFEDGDCPAGMVCAKTNFLTGSPSGGTCVECIDDGNCTDPTAPKCNEVTHTCGCTTDEDCVDPAFPDCNQETSTCECASDSGTCGPPESGVEAGVADGAVEESDAGEDDAGR